MNRVQKDINSVISSPELFGFLKGSDVLVTGATGLIGSMLIKTLMAADEKYDLGMRIIGQIRNSEKAAAIFGSDCQKITFTQTADVPCGFIFHTVSPTASKFFVENPVETIKTSVGSTMDILEIARKNKANLVYLSSMEEYGVPYVSGEIMTEDKVGIIDHLNVRSSYSESKRLCECLCAAYSSEYGVDVKIARLAQTFGAGVPLSDNRMPMQFARAAAEEKDIVLHTEGRTISNFVYLTDAVRGLLVLMRQGKSGEAYNICNDAETRSVREIADLVSSETAGGRINVRIEVKDNMGYTPESRMYLNSDKLRSLGWNAEVTMAEAYSRLKEYLIEQ